MSGKLIVCEGLDCSGKTTAIEGVINLNPEYVYSKGIGSDSRLGRVARRFPSTFMFLSELIYNAYVHILPSLREDKIVLQDRYDVSVASFVPNTNRWYNQFLIHAARLLIPEPDAIVYFHLPLEERIKRLKHKGKKYELMLAEHPEIITLREKEYEKWYDQFNGPKTRIDTEINSIKQTARILEDFVQNL
jgi:thymidylate kinase